MDIFHNKSQIEKEVIAHSIMANVSGAPELPLTGGTLTGILTGVGEAQTSLSSLSEVVIYSNATLDNALTLNTGSVLSAPTIAPLQITASTPSQSFFSFQGAVFSTASINLGASKVAAVVLVQYNIGGVQKTGYLPIFLGVS